MSIKRIEVVFDHMDTGTGVEYYRTKPNKQLVCIVDGSWHTATDDGTWEEPEFPIDEANYQLVIVGE